MDTNHVDAPEALERSLTLPVGTDELWSVVADGASWPDWLVDDADVLVADGAGGTVVDDGEVRTVAVDEVSDAERRVVFRWWPEGGTASRVTLVVAPAPDGTSTLRVTEVPVAPVRASMSARACSGGMALLRLWLLVSSTARV